MISSFDYRYNDINNRMAVGEASGDRVTWTYDNSSQLTSEHRSGANACRNTFVYDPVGNRLVLNNDGTRTTSTFDAVNQIEHSEATAGRTTYTFDTDGNQQIVEAPSGNRTTNVWDFENRLTNVTLPDATRSSMTYQPDNLRVTSDDGTTAKTWLWDQQNYLAQTDGGVLVFTNTPNEYGDLVSQNDGTSTNWYHFDARGDTKELTQAAETVTDTRVYDAWGNVISSTGTTPMPFGFIGKLGYIFDVVTQLYNVRERWYRQTSANWISVDPFNAMTGDNFIYASNNPTTLTDPSGLIVEALPGGTTAVACASDSALFSPFKFSIGIRWPCQRSTIGVFVIEYGLSLCFHGSCDKCEEKTLDYYEYRVLEKKKAVGVLRPVYSVKVNAAMDPDGSWDSGGKTGERGFFAYTFHVKFFCATNAQGKPKPGEIHESEGVNLNQGGIPLNGGSIGTEGPTGPKPPINWDNPQSDVGHVSWIAIWNCCENGQAPSSQQVPVPPVRK
ncbi:MAG: RHS repeat-associated core domain-containing protein [Parvibaculaceae bacterium]